MRRKICFGRICSAHFGIRGIYDTSKGTIFLSKLAFSTLVEITLQSQISFDARVDKVIPLNIGCMLA